MAKASRKRTKPGKSTRTHARALAPKAKSKAKPKASPPVPIVGVALQRELTRVLSFHARRLDDAMECGATGTELMQDVARNCANAFERTLLDCLLTDRSSAPLAYVVDVLTGFPKAKR